MKQDFNNMLQNSVIIQSKQAKKVRQKQKKQRKYWPEDYLKPRQGQSKLEHYLEIKMGDEEDPGDDLYWMEKD